MIPGLILASSMERIVAIPEHKSTFVCAIFSEALWNGFDFQTTSMPGERMRSQNNVVVRKRRFWTHRQLEYTYTNVEYTVVSQDALARPEMADSVTVTNAQSAQGLS